MSAQLDYLLYPILVLHAKLLVLPVQQMDQLPVQDAILRTRIIFYKVKDVLVNVIITTMLIKRQDNVRHVLVLVRLVQLKHLAKVV